MKREEAIYWIKNLAVLSSEKDMASITEALNMAIEALEQEGIIRCKDCKHFDEENGVCKVDGNGGWQADDFCSTGERKEQ